MYRLALILAATTLLVACNADPAPAPAGPTTAAPDVAGDCLLMVWSAQDTRDVPFDREHDKVEGGAISCATGTSASRFEEAIDALRTAARSGDKARVLDQLGLPMTFIDAGGERHELQDRAAIEAVFDDVFDERMLATLRDLDLDHMAVARDGGSFALGTLWLVVDEAGGRPRLVTVNRQALDEAAAAAVRQAERNQGAPVPFDKP